MNDLRETECTLFGRLSYSHIWEAVTSKVPGMEKKDPQFSGTILIKKTDVNQIAAFNAAQEAAILLGVDKKSKGRRPNKIALALLDGDGVTAKKGDPLPPEYAGHWYVRAINSQDSPPQIVDLDGNPLTNRRDIFSGCYVRFGVNLAYYDHPTGGAGVSVYLGAVQLVDNNVTPFASTGITAARAFAAPIDPALIDAYKNDAPSSNKPKPSFLPTSKIMSSTNSDKPKPSFMKGNAPASQATEKPKPSFMSGGAKAPVPPPVKPKPSFMKGK